MHLVEGNEIAICLDLFLLSFQGFLAPENGMIFQVPKAPEPSSLFCVTDSYPSIRGASQRNLQTKLPILPPNHLLLGGCPRCSMGGT